MSNETLAFLIILILLLGALPAWPYSNSWGYYPSGIFTVILAVFLFWALSESRPLFRSTGQDLKATAQDVGHDLKEAGRDTAASIRRTVQ